METREPDELLALSWASVFDEKKSMETNKELKQKTARETGEK